MPADLSPVRPGNAERLSRMVQLATTADNGDEPFVHNHPSGDPTPSPDDLHLTAEVLAAGRLLDIALLDHIVLGSDTYVSLRDRGISFDRPAA